MAPIIPELLLGLLEKTKGKEFLRKAIFSSTAGLVFFFFTLGPFGKCFLAENKPLVENCLERKVGQGGQKEIMCSICSKNNLAVFDMVISTSFAKGQIKP